ncbi:beta-galactosidase [Pseudarcicella hirudinis]|uniref:beta-galactosidase n=1 Tax=Pseudarcicella hirudinis TaxID=1079859 RepID=UPI0035EB049E
MTAFNAFSFGWGAKENYNDILRPFYDALYRSNLDVDFIDPTSTDIEKYKLIIVPALYAAPDSLLNRLNRFVKNGGNVVYTFKSGFSDENVKVRPAVQPGIINEACGISYSQFTIPDNVSLKGDPYKVGKEKNQVKNWMELVTPTTAKVLASYDHPVWGKYAAITENKYGKGTATYIGCMTSNSLTEKIIQETVKNAGLWGPNQEIAFPVITKSGVNQYGKKIHYYFNYSSSPGNFTYPYNGGTDLLSNTRIDKNARITLEPWGMKIVEE